MSPLMSQQEIAELNRQPRVHRCYRTAVTVVQTTEGPWEQSEDGDIVRSVTYYYLDDGTLIARLDEYPEART